MKNYLNFIFYNKTKFGLKLLEALPDATSMWFN